MSYCTAIKNLEPLHQLYHDTQYGFPIHDDDELFGRLLLEINQAGLSWTTILKKQESFRSSYSNFCIGDIANYTEKDTQRLLNDPGIIRNRLKVNAAIYNAQRVIELREEWGSFKDWLDHFHPLTREEWVKLFKKTFKFTGGEITHEFLMSTGYLKGAHDPSCPIYRKIESLNPPWNIS